MVCADSLGRPDDAIAYARAGLAVHRSEDAARRRKDKIEEMEKRIADADARRGR
jgi:hypothetical protein